MPEGDSVYRLARRLEVALVGRRLSEGELRVPRFATVTLAGRTVTAMDTHGKHLLTRLSSGLTLHTHLRMSGSWTVTRPDRRLPRHLMPRVRVLLRCEDGPTAYGIDLPVVEVVRTDRERDVVGHLGPDPLRADFDGAQAVANFAAAPRREVGAALLDQQTIAGLGNLWMNELCFLRGHSPWTPSAEVDLDRLVALAARALRVSAHADVPQVTTGDRRRGAQHWVAGRAGRPCLRCGATVRVVAAEQSPGIGRRTWWCPSCQPGPTPF